MYNSSLLLYQFLVELLYCHQFISWAWDGWNSSDWEFNYEKNILHKTDAMVDLHPSVKKHHESILAGKKCSLS